MKINGEKNSRFRLAKMFLKTNELSSSCQDVDEKKGERRWVGDEAICDL
jgi:hypothetical protein